jgi:general stress protein YciG
VEQAGAAAFWMSEFHTMSSSGKSKRGFAAMHPAKQRAIASKGGKAAHAAGRAHEFTTAEASAAGRKGGLEAHRRGKAHRFTPEEAQAAVHKALLARRCRRHARTVCRPRNGRGGVNCGPMSSTRWPRHVSKRTGKRSR